MTLTWIHLGLVLLGAAVMALYNRGTPSAGSAPVSPSQALPGKNSGGAAGVQPASAAAGHPIIASLVSVLESTLSQNPQLAQLEGAVVTLLHPNGNINLSLTKGGSHVAAASPIPSLAAAAVPAAGVAQTS